MPFELDSALLKVIDGAQKSQKAIDSLSPVASKASESVKAISKASESVDKLESSFKNTRDAVGNTRSAVFDLIQAFTDNTGERSIENIGEKARGVVQSISNVSKAAEDMRTSFKNTKDEIENVKNTASNLYKAFAGTDLGKKSINFIGKQASKVSQKFPKSNGGKASGVLNKGGQVIGKAVDGVQKAKKAVEGLAPVASKATESVQAISKASESVGKVKNSFNDTKDAVGNVRTSVSDLIQAFTNNTGERSIENIGQKAKEVVKSISNASKTVEDLATNFINAKDEIKNVKSTVSDFFKTFKDNDLVKKATDGIGKRASKVAQKIPKLNSAKVSRTVKSAGIGSKGSNVLNIAKQSMGKVGALTPSLSAPLQGLAGSFEKIKGVVSKSFSSIFGIFTKLPLPLQIIIGVVGLLAVAFATNFGGIRDIVMGVFNKISGAAKAAIDTFKKTGSAAQGIGALFTNLFGPKVGNIVTQTINKIITVVKSIVTFIQANMPKIKSIIQNVFKGIQSVWNSILKPVLTFAIQIFSKLISFVMSNWPRIKQTITTVMTAIKTVISTALNMIMAFWNVHGQTIKAVVSSAFNIIKTVIMTVLNVITGVIKTVMQVINGDWSGAWNTIKSTVGTVFNGAIDIIRNILNAIGSIFKDMAKTAISWGKDMIMGIVDGIKGAVGYIEDAISGVADRIRSFLHFSVPDKGPLTDYETWMPDFLKGMGRGIKVNTHLVTEPIKDLAVGIKTGVNKNLSSGSKTSSQGFKGASGLTKDDSSQNGFAITIAKLADSIIIREESDIDKIATALANKLSQTALGMS
ncbi:MULTISPECIES: phage tail protein [Clostridium]|uniref:phage tail protein n=1 Tax=Clostridium TaxID=1485 RepID=UPI00040473D5|nr:MULTISPECIES: hypothetical protein [Clostridium]MBN7573674.1 hypothetical protein [Clostridium beijerinckii]MBN7578912.1 hypothetical protein [Clostridium beijerinckii]MBN7583305.1 hypothetical protein [Clostridium beijerinckii]MBO0521217.1 hypothetical protein [Clostridium beijerinckii]MZK52631.1 hypothetical protein [Clostridium beijerinckii]